MNPMPTETLLLGLTPRQYTALMAQARLDAQRLRREAMREATDAFGDRLLRAVAALQHGLRQLAHTRVAEA